MFAPPSSPIAGVLDQLKAIVDDAADPDPDATPERLLGTAAGLRHRLALVPDPRRAAGKRHSLLSVLLVTVCAPAADKNVFTHIEAWARDAPPVVLAAMDVRFDALSGRHVPPDESTLRDVLSRIDATALAQATADHPADLAVQHPDIDSPNRSTSARPAVRGPGPANPRGPAGVRRGRQTSGRSPPPRRHPRQPAIGTSHATGDTLAQHEIAARTNEIPEPAVLLADTDLAGALLTVDALHTQRETARMIAEDHQGFYLMTAKANQPKLRSAIATRFGAPNSDFQAEGRYHSAENRGHGHVERAHRHGRRHRLPTRRPDRPHHPPHQETRHRTRLEPQRTRLRHHQPARGPGRTR